MQAFRISDLQLGGKAYIEFLRSADLSVGVYRLAVGAEDLQQPHTEDEVYYVISGRGSFRAGESDREVVAGDVLFVAAGEVHRFHGVVEDLELLIFFGPPEGTRGHTSAEE
jgi:mannose-6-phosphate isomerase-like protein (cupin superfamily)